MKRALLFFSLLLFGPNAFPQAFINYHRFNSPLPDNSVRSIAIDAQGRKWFGTDYGLAVFNDTTWAVYTTLNSGISDNSIKCIRFDAGGNAWICTSVGGVNKFEGTNWTTFTTLNSGITSDVTRYIDIDVNDVKWICTDNG